MADKLIVYGHRFCSMVAAMRRWLEASEVDYTYVDIHRDPAGREAVREINHGNESVPTLVFPDGTTMTEPSTREVNAKLKALGIPVQPIGVLERLRFMVTAPAFRILAAILVVAGLARDLDLLLGLGLVLLIVSVIVGQMK